MNHCDVDPDLRRIGQRLVVFTETTTLPEPSECSFNNPPSCQGLELMTVLGTFHNLHDPITQLSGVARVSPDELEVRESPYQFVNNQLSSISVLDISRVDHNSQEQTNGIHNDMPLLVHQLLASIITPVAPFPSSLPTGVDDRCARCGVFALSPTHLGSKSLMDSFQRTIAPPRPEIQPYGPPRWRVVWQRPPGTPVPKNTQDALMTSRRSVERGLPSVLGGGSKGASSFHCSSVRSLGYSLRFTPSGIIYF